jgi:biofilm PGA synthesis N-glycosyltransferase PgaC
MWSIWVIGACLLYIFWVILGYPLVLSVLPSRRPQAELLDDFAPSITVILPVHNGAAFLATKLDSILASDWDPEKLEVLVLSDGSTDETDRIAETYAAAGRVRFVRLPRGGKATALNEALARTDREILLMTDVRQRLAPNCIPKLIARLRDPEVAVVSGKLVILPGKNAEEVSVGLYWKYESRIRSNLSRHDSLLGASGAIYAMRRELARPLPPDCLLDDVWLPMQAVLKGFRAVREDDAIVWDYPTALHTEFNRKVRTQAGIYQLLRHEPRLLTRANRLRWHFISHKLGRLFLPHIILVMVAASFWLPGWGRVCALAVELGIPALAGIDLLMKDENRLRRLTGPTRAVLGLVAAAFCAQSIFFVEPARLWKVTHGSAATSPM